MYIAIYVYILCGSIYIKDKKSAIFSIMQQGTGCHIKQDGEYSTVWKIYMINYTPYTRLNGFKGSNNFHNIKQYASSHKFQLTFVFTNNMDIRIVAKWHLCCRALAS